MMKTLICFSILIGLGSCMQLTGASFKPCDGFPQDIKSVVVEPCTSEPCTFNAGDQVNVEGVFIPNKDTASDCKLDFKANLGGAWVDIFTDPICGTNLDCPLKNGNTHTLKYGLTVSSALSGPNPTETRWRIICDGDASEALCADITIHVQ